jgi:hypothetical protein
MKPQKKFLDMQPYKQPWLEDALIESVFIIAPAFLPVFAVYAFHDYFAIHEVSTMWWVILVICVDVSHVYSTLFRLYWDRETFSKNKRLLLLIPVTAFVIGFALHYYDPPVFWRLLAYVAAFHFIRQQYGFMRLYSRKENASAFNRLLDQLAIYSATIYPLIYWHVHATTKLGWFVAGDFVKLNIGSFEIALTSLYWLILSMYFLRELILFIKSGVINLPKNLIVAGTYISWYVGIVSFQGDLIFTFLNVVAHGIPYMALIWIHGKKRSANFKFNSKGILIFITSIFMLAYLEENFWDSLIWNDHPEIFFVQGSAFLLQHPVSISIGVALLVLPQVTHYVLDGFIWKLSKNSASLKL